MAAVEATRNPHRLPEAIRITDAKTEAGRARGRDIGFPTINVSISPLRGKIPHGIYACRISFGGKSYPGAMHYGDRPVFMDSETLEVHVIDEVITATPKTVDIEVVGFLRGVENFPDIRSLQDAIRRDVEAARGMLALA